ncbi:TIGR04222 domain-containing membrane protein [Actinomadura yumaensis]|uniref:TIGR04222 domain-containing membrane protein n=1 Tax=Actinomadura yumaensis TaxID=111807 RepID=A0ABW2CX14_9ACTN
MPLAAAGDTWGVPGPLFLWGLYVPAAIVVYVLVVLTRRLCAPGRDPARDLHPYEVAYLLGEGRRAVAAALTLLRAEGAIEAYDKGKIRVTGSRRDPGTPLDDAVHRALASGGASSPGDVADSPQVKTALDELRQGLSREGLLLSPADHARRRLASLPFAAVWLVAVARLVAAVRGDKPMGFLIAALIVTSLFLLYLMVDPEGRTRAGDRVAAGFRERYAHLDPARQPAWTTYGGAATALGVAVFGATALASFDPAFAETSDIHGQLSPSGGGDIGGGCGSGCSGGGGGGCGGCGGCGG